MRLDDPRVLLAAFAMVALIALWLGLRIARASRQWETRARNRVAQDGEAEAESILEDHGFRVLDRQVRAGFSISIDGEEVPVEVRADLIVTKRGKTYVAEVKTGGVAPNPAYPATRRQLLEYALVFQASEILLVDVPARAVREVSFCLTE